MAAPHLLIIDARFYDEISDELVRGAVAELDAAGVSHDRISVPGVLEIPAALSMVLMASDEGKGTDYDGFVLLGCVIRGQTSHYDIVAGESARAVMDLTVDLGLALGNGILTVENGEQALVRAGVAQTNKGGDAAKAALALIAVRESLGG